MNFCRESSIEPTAPRLRIVCNAAWSKLTVRWLKFNGAGIAGVGVQLAALAALIHGAAVHYMLATPLSVEAAVIHNFFWHERVTWRDRTRAAPGAALRRFLRFNMSNGALSIAGNLLLMRWLAGYAHMSYLASNLAAIAVCSTANFLISEVYVFRKTA